MSDVFNSGSSDAVSGFDAISKSLGGISQASDKVSKSLARTFASAIVSGKSFDETLRAVGLSLSKLALTSSLQSLMQTVTRSASSSLSSLFGGGGGGASVTPFAEGGVVSRPTFFGMNGGLGLMGERGAEAIMPLSRGPDGRLGVATNAAGQAPVSVNVTISTPDAESFRQSQVQISSALARAVMRGQRGL